MIESITVLGETFPIEKKIQENNGLKKTTFYTVLNGIQHKLSAEYTEALETELATTGLNVSKELGAVMKEEFQMELEQIIKSQKHKKYY